MDEIDNIQVWDDIFLDNEWGKYPPLSVVRFIARNFYKIPKDERSKIKILEVGAGTGANLWFCAREGFSVIALDGSQNATDRLHSRFDEDGLSSFLNNSIVGDYHSTLDDIEDLSVDAILDVESLSCNKYERSKEIITKMIKKIKPGGKILSVTFSDGSYGLSGEEIDKNTVLPVDGPAAGKGFIRYTRKEDIEDLYARHDCSVESIEKEELHLNNLEVISEWNIIASKKTS